MSHGNMVNPASCSKVNISLSRYIPNPLLLNGFKADIRTYMLIAGTCPYMVFYHPGYVRLSVVPYSLNQQEIHAHLTNQVSMSDFPSEARVSFFKGTCAWSSPILSRLSQVWVREVGRGRWEKEVGREVGRGRWG